MKNKYSLTVLLGISLLLTSLGINAENKSAIISSESTNNDSLVFKDFFSFKFFSLVNTNSAEMAKQIDTVATQELKKFGIVIPQSLNVQNPTDGINDPNGFFKSPSLIYRLDIPNDLQGKTLPVMMASLEFQTGATLDKTKEHFQPCFWSRKCFIQADPSVKLETSVQQTLSFLLTEFNKNFKEINKDNPVKVTFFYCTP